MSTTEEVEGLMRRVVREETSARPVARRPSRSRALLFSALALVLVVAAVEVGSFLLMAVLMDEGVDVAAKGSIVELEAATDSGRARMIRLVQSQTALHPFLGFGCGSFGTWRIGPVFNKIADFMRTETGLIPADMAW